MFKVGDVVVLREGAESPYVKRGVKYEVVETSDIYQCQAVWVLPTYSNNKEDKRFIFSYKLELYVEETTKSKHEESDLIDKQDHYTANGIEPIEIMRQNMTQEEYRGFLLGNIIKYPLRYKRKNGLEDLQKAKTYLTWLINDVEERGL